jgi:hypothetical protein
LDSGLPLKMPRLPLPLPLLLQMSPVLWTRMQRVRERLMQMTMVMLKKRRMTRLQKTQPRANTNETTTWFHLHLPSSDEAGDARFQPGIEKSV